MTPRHIPVQSLKNLEKNMDLTLQGLQNIPWKSVHLSKCQNVIIAILS